MSTNSHYISNGGNEAINLSTNMHANVNNINNYLINQEHGISVGKYKEDHGNRKFEDNSKTKEAILLEEEEITWGQVFNMMYSDAKDIISPLSKIIDYVAPDPNEEDSKFAKMAFEEKMSGKIKKPIMKYKMGSPDTMCVLNDHNIGNDNSTVKGLESIYTHEKCKSASNIKKRGLIGNLIEENVNSAMEILKSANNDEKSSGSVWDVKKYDEKRDNINDTYSPGTKQTPSTYYNTDSSPNSVVSGKEDSFQLKDSSHNKIAGKKDEEDGSEGIECETCEYDHAELDCKGDNVKSPKLSVVIPRLSLLDENIPEFKGRRILSNDSLFRDDTVSDRIKNIENKALKDINRRGSHTDRSRADSNNVSVVNNEDFSNSARMLESGIQNCDIKDSVLYRINKNGNVSKPYYHSHAYTMENISNTIQRPISRSIEKILNLYSKEELERIKSFVRKANELVYEGPLERKNSWSWGYKLRWVKIYNCEMHYFLSPKESRIRGKNPLGVINFKVAEWSLNISNNDDKTFTIVSYGNNRNGRGYQWRIPENSEQSRKSWTNRIEKILKATAFMQQLKGVIKLPI
ncbi:pleckstrin homology domain containing protein [Cryptosporidium ryanae]|uniref:pleckstrin homology domain containing protein n=1 Tax=Cryptosporidium ryanae TaxID=515981 RepID=UPI00351A3692|nr:pleckstrin homology domain containing protein [Cryptosporidium ryanae]